MKRFDCDRAAQYAILRTKMAMKHYRKYFRRKTMKNVIVDDDLTPEELQKKKQERKEIDAQVRIGYNKVLEKGKDIRQKFFNTLINGTRNGNGKRVLETL